MLSLMTNNIDYEWYLDSPGPDHGSPDWSVQLDSASGEDHFHCPYISAGSKGQRTERE